MGQQLWIFRILFTSLGATEQKLVLILFHHFQHRSWLYQFPIYIATKFQTNYAGQHFICFRCLILSSGLFTELTTALRMQWTELVPTSTSRRFQYLELTQLAPPGAILRTAIHFQLEKKCIAALIAMQCDHVHLQQTAEHKSCIITINHPHFARERTVLANPIHLPALLSQLRF